MSRSLALVVCAAPLARRAPDLATALIDDGWPGAGAARGGAIPKESARRWCVAGHGQLLARAQSHERLRRPDAGSRASVPVVEPRQVDQLDVAPVAGHRDELGPEPRTREQQQPGRSGVVPVVDQQGPDVLQPGQVVKGTRTTGRLRLAERGDHGSPGVPLLVRCKDEHVGLVLGSTRRIVDHRMTGDTRRCLECRSEPAQQVALALPPTPADDPNVQSGPGTCGDPGDVRPLVCAVEEVPGRSTKSVLTAVWLRRTSVERFVNVYATRRVRSSTSVARRRASIRDVTVQTLSSISSAVAVHTMGAQSLFQCSTNDSIALPDHLPGDDTVPDLDLIHPRRARVRPVGRPGRCVGVRPRRVPCLPAGPHPHADERDAERVAEELGDLPRPSRHATHFPV